MSVHRGDEVKWLSRANYDRWLKGKVVKTLESGAVAVVDDGLGQSLRCMDSTRLQLIGGPRKRYFAGQSA